MLGGQGDRRKDARFGTDKAEVGTEDFLFHLYRGSELLQDSRVHEAKEELENALRLQPRDPKGQDLLAVVYFRLGLYPRAIEIYEDLVRAFPADVSLGNNLALCYLKTGQTERARAVLEDLVRVQPDHVRAWAYLGLAFERLGDYEKARRAFERGQQQGMARRMSEILGVEHQAETPSSPAEEQGNGDKAPTSESFHELDDGQVSYSIAAPALPHAGAHFRSAGTPYEGRKTRRVTLPASMPPEARSVGGDPRGVQAPGRGPDFLTVGALVRDVALAFPSEAGAAWHPNGLVAVRIDQSFATRLEAIRAYGSPNGKLATAPLARKSRGRQLDEPLGTATAPIVSVTGAGTMVLGPRGEQRLLPLSLEDESIYVREGSLLGFDGQLAYECGRLAVGDGEAISMTNLRGRGAVILEISSTPLTIEVSADRPVTVRREIILGWTGRLLPHEVPPSDSPAAARGLVCFAGDGALLLYAETATLPS